MCSTCPAAIEDAIDRWSAKVRRFYTDLRNRMNGGKYDPAYMDLVVSPSGGKRYTLADAWVFGQFIAMVWDGRVMMWQVGFREPVSGPESDRDRGENNELLSLLIPPFNGHFKGQGHDGDGWIEWTEPIQLERKLDRGRKVTREFIWIEPDRLLLEARDLHNQNGWHHLSWETGFARWPYGSDKVWIMLWHESEFERRGISHVLRIPCRGNPEVFKKVVGCQGRSS
jgi:hypothetical protein